MVNLKLRPRPWRRGKGAAVAYTLQALSIEAGPGSQIYMVPRCEFKVKLAQAYVLGERGTTASYSHDKPAKRGKMTEKTRVDVGI